MQIPSFDLFRKDAQGQSVWLATAPDLETARLRLSEFASACPGEYYAFDQTTHSVVVSYIGLGSGLLQ